MFTGQRTRRAMRSIANGPMSACLSARELAGPLGRQSTLGDRLALERRQRPLRQFSQESFG
jgi:hypothetical protein